LFSATSLASFFCYKMNGSKEVDISRGHYRFGMPITNVTPWEANYYSWYRMPDLEYLSKHQFKPYYIIGQMDHSKEILIPKKKEGIEGFLVFNPLYCYDGGKLKIMELTDTKEAPKGIEIERAAVIVNRGWIPYNLKDKRSRPWEQSTRDLVKIRGTFRRTHSMYKYTIPNNGNDNDWHNIVVEDMARFWELPNADEFKYFYFEQM